MHSSMSPSVLAIIQVMLMFLCYNGLVNLRTKSEKAVILTNTYVHIAYYTPSFWRFRRFFAEIVNLRWAFSVYSDNLELEWLISNENDLILRNRLWCCDSKPVIFRARHSLAPVCLLPVSCPVKRYNRKNCFCPSLLTLLSSLFSLFCLGVCWKGF